jgi:hypothetical protein
MKKLTGGANRVAFSIRANRRPVQWLDISRPHWMPH